MESKRGQGGLITTVLIIVVVLAAVAIIGMFIIRNITTTTQTAENRSQAQIWDLSITIPDVALTDAVIRDNKMIITITRSGGQETSPIKVMVYITYTSGNVQNYTTDVPIALLETRTYSIQLNAPDPKKVEIYPIAIRDGKEVITRSAGSKIFTGVAGITGLVAYYPFNGDAKDASGAGGPTGLMVGANCSANGRTGTGCYFDGNDYIDFSDNLGSVFASNNYTISVWVNLTSYTDSAGSTGMIIQKWNAGGQTDNAFIVYADGSFVSNKGCPSCKKTVFTAPALGSWQHIAISMNSGTLNVYVNGASIASASDHSSGTTAKPLRIGNLWNGYYNLNGTVDEVRIYNRPLSAEEIQTLYLYK